MPQLFSVNSASLRLVSLSTAMTPTRLPLAYFFICSSSGCTGATSNMPVTFLQGNP